MGSRANLWENSIPLRGATSYLDFVKTQMELQNCDDMRDSRAIESSATAMLKILFPDQQPTEQDFYRYCVNPALEMRQRVRDELSRLDREYAPISMRSKYPDAFQLTHQRADYVDPSEVSVPVVRRVSYAEAEAEAEAEAVEAYLVGQPPTPPDSQERDEPQEKTVRIAEGETGHSYKSLFGPYLKGASSIELADPYIRLEFQIRNLLAFIGILDTSEGPMNLHLVTSTDDEYQRRINSQKFDEIAAGLGDNGAPHSALSSAIRSTVAA